MALLDWWGRSSPTAECYFCLAFRLQIAIVMDVIGLQPCGETMRMYRFAALSCSDQAGCNEKRNTCLCRSNSRNGHCRAWWDWTRTWEREGERERSAGLAPTGCRSGTDGTKDICGKAEGEAEAEAKRRPPPPPSVHPPLRQVVKQSVMGHGPWSLVRLGNATLLNCGSDCLSIMVLPLA